MPPRLFLIDANNFYVASEQVFNPKLVGRPVVALSNNDGAVVSRSPEAKALGVKMSQPWFQLKDLVRDHGLIGLSSNYTLYADLSNRFMSIVSEMAPTMEVYSIDECFTDHTGVPALEDQARSIRDRIKQWVGLTVCVGCGQTKVRAKLANHIAKTTPAHAGVFNLEALPDLQQDVLLGQIPVGEVWGVGPRTAPRLQSMGITSVAALRDADPKHIRSQFGVVLERIVLELRGVPCLSLEETRAPRKQILCSRSFGSDVVSKTELREAVLSYVANAATKLRAQKSLAGAVMVFIATSPFGAKDRYYSRSYTVAFPSPTDDTLALTRAAAAALEHIFRDGYRYKRAGAMLLDLSPAERRQATLFDGPDGDDRRERLNQAMDSVNARYGRGTAVVAVAGIHHRWGMKRTNLSPCYTTRWEDIVTVQS
ncbi:MAG: Y-family DNA polymerase [Nevskiaceae bacterium]|nr:MAG: Y-family DNA polymerase [Nevskiaceae bacterium]